MTRIVRSAYGFTLPLCMSLACLSAVPCRAADDPLGRLSRFNLVREYPAPELSDPLLVGDLNGDDAAELVMNVPGGLEIWRNDGHGQFPERWTDPAHAAGIQALFDVDDDGQLDLVRIDPANGGSVRWWRGLGDCHFEIDSKPAPNATGSAPSGSGDLAIGTLRVMDVDGDGHLDLIGGETVVNRPMHLWLARAGGTFAHRLGPRIAGIAETFVVADFNRDGHPDLVCGLRCYFNCSGTELPSEVQILLADGAGGYEAVAHVDQSASLRDAIPFDADGDGEVDVVSANEYDVKIIHNAGNGRSWSVTSSVPGPGGATLGLIDARGDGRPHLCAAFGGSDGFLLGGWIAEAEPGRGPDDPRNRLFAVPRGVGIGSSPAPRLIAVDLNGDGLEDLVMTRYVLGPEPRKPPSICVALTHSNGTLGAPAFIMSAGPGGTVAARFGRERRDVLVTPARGAFVVTEWQSDGTIRSIGPFQHGTPVRALDLDRDGHDELITSLPGDSLMILHMTPAGRPRGKPQVLTGRWLGDADVNGDGLPELLLARNGEAYVAWNERGRAWRVTDTGVPLPSHGTMVLADPTGSGRPGLVRLFCNDASERVAATDTVSVYRIERDGECIEVAQSLVAGMDTYVLYEPFAEVSVAELDGKSGEDLLVQYGLFAGAIRVLHATGDGHYVADDRRSDLGGELPSAVALGDLDGDGTIDAVFGTSYESEDGLLRFIWNVGHGALGPSNAGDEIWLGGGGTGTPLLADLDGDGAIDIVWPEGVDIRDYEYRGAIGVIFGTAPTGCHVHRQRHPWRRELDAAPVAMSLRVLQLTPNPSHGAIAVNFTAAPRDPVTIELSDLAGRRVAHDVLAPAASGENAWSYGRRGALPAGIYWLRLSQGASHSTSKVVVLN